MRKPQLPPWKKRMHQFLKLENKAKLLLAAELAFILSSIAWDTFAIFWLGFVFPIFFAICACVLAGEKRMFYPYIALAAAALIAESIPDGIIVSLVQATCHVAGFYLLAREVLRHSFFRDKVPPTDRVLAGIAGYILLGLFALLISKTISEVQPNAFLNQINGEPASLADLLYFSFVTLTSLGYGEIAPITQPAKIFSILVALSGTLYLAVLIASLISKNHQTHVN